MYTKDDDVVNIRLIFRPTKDAYERFITLFETSRWRNKSDLIREIFRKGLEVVEREEM